MQREPWIGSPEYQAITSRLRTARAIRDDADPHTPFYAAAERNLIEAEQAFGQAVMMWSARTHDIPMPDNVVPLFTANLLLDIVQQADIQYTE
jgi:hypothetical protein